MVRIGAWARAVGVALAFSTVPALAQTPPRARADAPKDRAAGAGQRSSSKEPVARGAGRATPVVLVASPAVQREIKLTDAQLGQILLLNDEFDRLRTARVRDAMKRDGRLDPEALSTLIASLRAEQEAAIGQVLDPTQRRRLGQISLQVEGLTALARPDVAESIRLRPDQLVLVQGLVEQYESARDELWADQVRRLHAPPRADRSAVKPGRPKRGQPPADAGRPQRAEVGDGGAGRAAPDRVDDQAKRINVEEERLYEQFAARLRTLLSRPQKAALDRLLGDPFDPRQLRPDRQAQRAALPDDLPTILQPASPARERP